jgi:tetratricopeptide (TPR) repeat protein
MPDKPDPEFEELQKQVRALLRSKKTDEALALLENYRDANPQKAEAHETLGMAYFHTGKLDKASEQFEKVTRIKPRAGTAFINWGAVLNRMGNHQRAVEVLRKGVQIERSSAIGYYNLGFAHRRLNQQGLAIPAYREAIRLDPQMAEAYQNLGNVYLDMKNIQQAIIQFKKALEVNPEFEKARRGLEAAEQARSAAKSAVNPFGRLVETATLEKQRDMDSKFRILNETERDMDRQALRQLLTNARLVAREMIELASQKIEPSIHQLDRTAIQDPSNLQALQEAANNFKRTIDIYQRMVLKFKERLQHLGQHQEMMLESSTHK